MGGALLLFLLWTLISLCLTHHFASTVGCPERSRLIGPRARSCYLAAVLRRVIFRAELHSKQHAPAITLILLSAGILETAVPKVGVPSMDRQR